MNANLAGPERSAINASARTDSGDPIAGRCASATRTTQNSAILGLGSVFARLDGTATPAPGLVHFTRTARAARITATARITRNARL